jgi:hypothetical protein
MPAAGTSLRRTVSASIGIAAALGTARVPDSVLFCTDSLVKRHLKGCSMLRAVAAPRTIASQGLADPD